MLAELPSVEEAAGLRAHDLEALAGWWAVRLRGFERSELREVLARCELQIPHPCTKLKAIKLVGNEVELSYARLRRTYLEGRTLDLDRSQLRKGQCQLRFIEATSSVAPSEYDKRVVQPRNEEWEAAHGAMRVTTLPAGYEGRSWSEDDRVA